MIWEIQQLLCSSTAPQRSEQTVCHIRKEIHRLSKAAAKVLAGIVRDRDNISPNVALPSAKPPGVGKCKYMQCVPTLAKAFPTCASYQ